MTAPATHLRIEHLGDAVLGLGVPAPRLSWQLPLGAAGQVAYRVLADGWDSGRVEGADHVLVPWGGPPVGSRTRVGWRVQVWTDLGEHQWSAPAWFETGLLDPGDWQAQWIEPDEPERRPDGDRPAHVLRHTFTLGAVATPARLYATAHGIYEAFLNGQRVGDLELTPGFTSYWANVHVQTYDVADLLVPGENVWEVVLSDGWYRGRFGFTQQADNYGDTVAFLGQLHVGDQVVVTGPEWRSAPGPIVAADLMAVLHDAYDLEPFVQVIDEAPSTRATVGSNNAHVTVRYDERTGYVVALGAIDNILKGASGQAVQCANLALGLDETAGLPVAGLYA